MGETKVRCHCPLKNHKDHHPVHQHGDPLQHDKEHCCHHPHGAECERTTIVILFQHH